MERNKTYELIDLALDIIEGGNGYGNDYPFVEVELSNVASLLGVRIQDRGLTSGKPLVGFYLINSEFDNDYDECLEHLKRLKEDIKNGK